MLLQCVCKMLMNVIFELSGNLAWCTFLCTFFIYFVYPLIHFYTLLNNLCTSQYLKITQNIEVEFIDFGNFHQVLSFKKLTCLAILFDHKLQVFKTRQIDHFWYFKMNFCPLQWKRSSLRSQCWMRLFLWFSNILCNWLTVKNFPIESIVCLPKTVSKGSV